MAIPKKVIHQDFHHAEWYDDRTWIKNEVRAMTIGHILSVLV